MEASHRIDRIVVRLVEPVNDSRLAGAILEESAPVQGNDEAPLELRALELPTHCAQSGRLGASE